MRHHRAAAVPLKPAPQAWAQNDGAGQGDKSANGVYHRGSSEIMKAGSQRGKEMPRAAHQGQKTIGAPSPMPNDGVDKTGNGHAVKQVTCKSGAADHGAGGDRGAGVSERKLEEPEGQKSYTRALVCCRCSLEEKPMVSDEAVTMAEHEGETKRIKENAAEAGVHDAFHEDVHRLTGAAETCLEHGEAYLHAEHQEGSNQRPHCVDGINDSSGLKRGISGVDPAKHE